MSFNIALSGLTAARADLDVTGNNIANANTAGFKKSRAEFADIFAQNFARVSDSAVGGGSRVASVSQRFEQGNIQNTDNALDIAVVGEGFFVVEDGDGIVSYTRDGSYSVDRDGFVVNNFGKRLQVFPPTAVLGTFNTGSLVDLQLTTSVGAPSATSEVEASLNLAAEPAEILQAVVDGDAIDPTDVDTFQFTTSLTVFDSLGAPHTATIYARRATTIGLPVGAGAATTNDWEVALYIDGDNSVTIGDRDDDAATTGSGEFLTNITLSFDDNGALVTPATPTATNPDPSRVDFFDGSGATTPFTSLELENGSQPLQFLFDFTGTTQLGTRYAVNNLEQDGISTGELAGVDISDEGVVQARFTNGRTDALGRIVLANFNNPSGLTQNGDNEWFESFDSGLVQYGEPGSSGFGSVQSGGLEESNVDLTEELVNLITAQRSFDANSQVIRTENEVTQTAVNLGR